MHPACLPDDELLKECDLGRSRASGPGGQHRNKVETAVVVTHRPTGVSGQASERRSQIENKKLAVRRLRLNLATHHRAPVGAGSMDFLRESPHVDPVPSALWRSRVKNQKISINPKHRDFPALLAEALDVIAAESWEAKDAATRLGVSTSQLIKLVKEHAPAFEMWNRQRQALRLHTLK